MHISLLSLVFLSSVAVSTWAQFNIQVVFTTAVSAAQKASFDAAAARWQQIITGDIGNTVTLRAGTRICGQPPQAADLQIDDLLIFAAIQPIDGAGKVLGSAGPCGFDNAGRVRLGSMQFDSADVANLLATNRFTATVLHEMGHIIGIGGDWARRGLVSPTAQGTPFTYLGQNGAAGQAAIGGTGKPIVEDIGGAGTARVHWKESVYQNELMTGFISGQTQPLSKLTAQSLIDLGYQVNVNAADEFLIPGATKSPTTAGATKSPTTAVTKSPTTAGATKSPTNAATKSPTVATKSPTLANDANNRFNIQVIFKTTPSSEQKAAFDAAVAKWESVITGDIGNTVTVAAGTQICGQTLAANVAVDDIVIFADISPIDGVGAVSVPCLASSSFTSTNLSFANAVLDKLVLAVLFDSADVANLITRGTFSATILHEMGHVLGIGTNWENKGLITPTAQGTPFLYLGQNGIQGQKDIGGSGNPIVEDIGGAGTARGHWKEAVYQNELMTGFLSGATQPMSRLTVQALKDIGYTVDLTKADAFTIPSQVGRRLRNLKDQEEMAEHDGHRELETTVWETAFPQDQIVWNLPTADKELTEDGEEKTEWETGYAGEVTFDLETTPKTSSSTDNSNSGSSASSSTGAIAGGIIGALAVVGAAAFVVVRRQKNASPSNTQMSAQNPMFGA